VHERERAVEETWAKHPAVSDALREVAQAETALGQLLEAATRERIQDRRRAVSPELRRKVKEARAARRDAKQRARVAKADAYASVAPALHAARNAERVHRKATYTEFVQHRGLYWATYNPVARTHDTAARKITAMRREGRPAALRHHRYEGTGRVAVQLQREKGHLCAPHRCWLVRKPVAWSTPAPSGGGDRVPRMARSEPQRTTQGGKGHDRIAKRVDASRRRRRVSYALPLREAKPQQPLTAAKC
jgi:hypothetical protein